MGIMARKAGEQFILTSDRIAGDLPKKAAPRRQLVEVYQVWTGDKWSTTLADAKTFTTIDVADEYIRANYTRVMAASGLCTTSKPTGTRLRFLERYGCDADRI